MTWRWILASLARLPQGMLSRGTGWVADMRLPRPLRGPVNGAFSRLVGIDVAEAEAPPEAHASLGAWFARRLRPGARRWPADPAAAASPVDGVVGALGRLEAGQLLQAKGIAYEAATLLGDPEEAARYEGGAFLTIYLSPRHYHRIHTPVAGRILKARAIPGRLMPVNAPAVDTIPGLFATNERLVVHLEAAGGHPVALVAVGAFNVGRISAAFDPGWHTNRPARERPGAETRHYDLEVGPGAEIAAFHLGSTVVLLFGPGAMGSPAGEDAGDAVPTAPSGMDGISGPSHPPRFADELVPGADIRLGDRLFR